MPRQSILSRQQALCKSVLRERGGRTASLSISAAAREGITEASQPGLDVVLWGLILPMISKVA